MEKDGFGLFCFRSGPYRILAVARSWREAFARFGRYFKVHGLDPAALGMIVLADELTPGFEGGIALNEKFVEKYMGIRSTRGTGGTPGNGGEAHI